MPLLDGERVTSYGYLGDEKLGMLGDMWGGEGERGQPSSRRDIGQHCRPRWHQIRTPMALRASRHMLPPVTWRTQVPKTKVEHYVPQCYLRKFTQDGRRLFVFDKVTKRSFPSNIRNVAAESDFYDIPQDDAPTGMDPQIVEKALQDIEDGYVRAVTRLLRNVHERRMMDEDDKARFAYFIMIQFLRTREFRNFYREAMEKPSKAYLDKALQTEKMNFAPDSYQVHVTEKTVWLAQVRFLFESKRLARFVHILTNHLWLIGINQTEHPLYTSDSPVVTRAHKTGPGPPHTGLRSEGIEIAFPLTSNHILILCERTFFAQYQELDCKAMPLKPDEVRYYNHLQVLRSYRHVYCESSDFGVAERICDECPEMAAPDRDRIRRSPENGG